MGRLTYREPQSGKIYFYTPDSEALEKLATYEDLDEKCIKEYGFDLYMIAQKYNEFLEHIHELAEYWELEKQGKLLSLPCKVHSTVYWITKFGVLERYVSSMDLTNINHIAIKLQPLGLDGESYPFPTIVFSEDFGKTVFLTQKEAEIALEKMKEDLHE